MSARTTPPATRVDVLVAGLGPGGCTAALAAHRQGLSTCAVEARGVEGTRERLVLVRPGAQEALARIGLPRFTEGRRASTIRHTENRLRAELVALQSGLVSTQPGQAPALALHWHTRVVALQPAADGVCVTLQDAQGGQSTVHAGYLIDATGGRLEPLGMPERRLYGPHHVVVTNEFDTEPWFDGIAGARDRDSREALVLVPMRGRGSITAYLDLPLGPVPDPQAAVARFEAVASRLGLIRPREASLAVDVVQRLLPRPGCGRIVPIGDSVGTVDLWLGAGMSTAIEDAVQAAEAIAAARQAGSVPAGGALVDAAQIAIHARHRRRSRQGRLMQAARPFLVLFWPVRPLVTLVRGDVRSPRVLWPAMRLVAGRRPSAAAPPG